MVSIRVRPTVQDVSVQNPIHRPGQDDAADMYTITKFSTLLPTPWADFFAPGDCNRSGAIAEWDRIGFPDRHVSVTG